MPAGARILIDAYAVLGVSATAELADIKRAYKRLARTHHPDVNRAPGAEEKFKEITAAYDLVKDDERRAAYDLRRKPATKPAARPPPPPPPPAERPAPPPPPPSPPPPSDTQGVKADVYIKVELTYAEAIRGAVKEVRFRRRQPCDSCHGVVTPRKTCRVCWGAGWEDIPSVYQWRVPPGIVPGAQVTVPGLGDRLPERTGDLRIAVAFLKMMGVTREGLDFQVLKRVPREVLEQGGTVVADGPAGPLTIRVPPRSKSGVVVRVPDAGLPEGRRKGSVFVTVRELIR